MGPFHLSQLRERTYHEIRYHHRLRGVGADTDQCYRSPMADTKTNTWISITTEECVHLDDMAGTYRFVRDGT